MIRIIIILTIIFIINHNITIINIVCGRPGLNETASPPAIESQELNSRILFTVHSLLGFSPFRCSWLPQFFYLTSPLTFLFWCKKACKVLLIQWSINKENFDLTWLDLTFPTPIFNQYHLPQVRIWLPVLWPKSHTWSSPIQWTHGL